MSRLFNLEAESALLGGVLTNSQWIGAANLHPEHFYAHEHGALWAELQARYREGRLIDLVSMKPWAEAQAALQPMGGATYLMDLMMRPACMAAQVAEYAAMIRDCARRRAVAGAAREAIGRAEQSDEDALTNLEARLQAIAADDSDADAWSALGEITADAIERAELGETAGWSTGIQRLDELTGGIRPAQLWVAGGATSMGKSLLGAFLSRSLATQGLGVGEVHLEMDDTQIGLRTASALAFDKDPKADSPHYLAAQRGKLNPDQWERMRLASKRAAQLPVHVDARPGRSLSQIEAAARRLFRKMQREGVKPAALVIDHEGLIAPEPGARFPSQLERTNARSEGLLAMAKRLNVAVIALSQITKEGSRADGEERLPNATDLNYGGAISQAANVVLLLHRRAYYEERKPKDQRDPRILLSREATLVVDKVRGGQRGLVSVLIDPPTGAIVDDQRGRSL